MALAATLLTTTGCSDDEVNDAPVIPDDQKELIRLSANDAAANPALTRAGFTGGTSKNLKTQIVARISSTNGSSTYHTRTLMTADPDTEANDGRNWNSVSAVDYSGDEYRRFWDDAFGRDAKLSVYAIAVPNKIGQTNNSTTLENKLTKGSTNVSSVNTKWQSDAENNVIEWKVTSAVTNDGTTTGQNATTLENEDLCYSNNIQSIDDGGNNGRFVYGAHGASTYPTYEWADHTSSCTHEQYKHDFYPNMDDGQMIFKLNDLAVTDGPGHFDHGHMIFKHALSRITVDLVGGDGFDYDNASSFTLQAQTTGCPASVDLLKMITTNKLNIQTGAWSTTASDITKSDHTYMSCGTKASGTSYGKDKTIYTLSAQVIPGYKVTDGVTNNNVMTFMIDGNNYYVTEDQVFDALNTTANTTASEADGSKKVNVVDNAITLEQGKNYHLTIKISKTKIESLTCTLVDWVDVEGSFAATNSYITFNSLSTEVNDCKHFELYRVLNLSNTITDPTHTNFDGTPQFMTGWADVDPDYTADKLSTEGSGAGVTIKTAGTAASTSTIWQTTWFFETNKSFYHFRTVYPGTSITSNDAGDYFTMYSGPVKDWSEENGAVNTISTAVDDNKMNDYHWGAIYKPSDTGASPSYTATLTYNASNGFESYLAGPVGPTTSTLNLIEQHMMSNIKVVLLTPADASGNYITASVDLFDETKTDAEKAPEVKITNFAGSATVLMGNGLITPATSYNAASIVTPPSFTDGEYGTDEGKNYYINNKSYQFPDATGSEKPYYHKSNPHTYRVVPQALVVGSNKVGLTIKTPDNNMYYVVEDLSTIKVSNVSTNALKNDYAGWNVSGSEKTIDRWLPGYTYTYYFILTKTGIQALTCTIVDWVEVEAERIDIDLES